MTSTAILIALGVFIFGSLIGLMILEIKQKDGDN